MSNEKITEIFPGPTLLLAGPGSGKTQELAGYIKWLIDEKGVDPNAIAVITFTNEATMNMRNRISNPNEQDLWVPLDKQPERISTMHSFGRHIISKELSTINLKENFRVVTSDRLEKILLGDAAQLIGLERELSETTADCRKKGNCNYDKNVSKCKVCMSYGDLLRICNSIDYNDQIMLACKILREKEEKLREYKDKIKYLLVDEYQDINRAQYDLIRMLIDKQEEGFLAVGDDNQSIYGWRGGNPEYVRQFNSFFGSKAKVIKRDICFRCPQHILAGALEIVKKFDPEGIDKPVNTFINKSGSKILFFDVASQNKEAEIIGQKIKKVINSHSVLILVRNRNFAIPIKAVLRKLGINYDCRSNVDETGLNVIDIVRKWIENPNDNFSFRECVQFIIDSGNLGIPSERVKSKAKKEEREKYLAKISGIWKPVFSDGISLFEACQKLASKDKLIEKIVSFLQEIIEAKTKKPNQFLDTVTRILEPWGNVDELLAEVNECIEEIGTLGGVGGGNCARILTMQGAKGLQADYVFVVGLDEGVIPRLGSSGNEIKEICRIVFVSMTRAQKELYLFHSRTRTSNITYLPTSYSLKSSPFINAISKDHIEKIYIK
ncbi:hypothetical protein A2159_03125 [Candidatus Woesebacteria bacterium RBG_13_34_9]|uniref:DNA 3'-5' helicase n=1 Tax=Candidatus Woesebacteria bacterium RBG_13_34_9 TaxID=1802477 RepID=A0A1F7X1E6_9BACT|nr:MAG: hypothetical protein A2159_03125 [Candidatus Woesebacteria bacterium RBG_13_34_9]